jgi:hypothetical protein
MCLRDRQLLAHLQEEVVCRVLTPEDGRVGCLTPLEYPNRDNVVVWIRSQNSGFEVTDYGDAVPDLPHSKPERQAFDEGAALIARGQGVELVRGRLTSRCELAEIGEHVWRVGTAAAQIAQLALAVHPRKRRKEREFVHEVEATLQKRHVQIERGREIEGRSGHIHHATIVLPHTETILEPVADHWNAVATTYAKFGDLQNQNGFQLYSLLDDRRKGPDEDLVNLLVQVSSVVQWSRRDDWLEAVS